jgi:signal transduction histidine kinase
VQLQSETFEQTRAEVVRRRARWYALAVIVLWVPLILFADPLTWGSVTGGLWARLPTAAGLVLLVLWLQRPRSRWGVEVPAIAAFGFVFAMWAPVVVLCTADTVNSNMLSIIAASTVVSLGVTLSWQSTAVLCAVATLAMFGAGLEREPRPGPEYFYLVSTAFIFNPLVILGAALRDRRSRSEFDLRQALRVANQQLKREQEARTQLFVNLSHDFRTPLAVVRAEVELLRARGGDDRALAGALDRIDANNASIAELIEQLLELARLDAAKAPHAPRSYDVLAVVREVAAQLQPSRSDIALVVCAPQRTFCAHVDLAHLRRILQNLAGNALRQVAARGGRVTLSVDTSVDGDPIIDVADNGPGVPPEQRLQIFERFASFRNEGSTVSGIGLALARELAELNGGKLELVEGARETTFRLRLKVALDSEMTATQPAIARAAQGVSPSASDPASRALPALKLSAAGGPKPRLLVVEDSPDLRSALERLLAPTFEVEAVATLAFAIEALARQVPAAILTDIMLPDGDGYELLAAVRLGPSLARVPVILVSALGEAAQRARGLAAGADDYLAKPFSGEELVARLANAIERRRERALLLERQREDLLNELHDGVCGSLVRAVLALGPITTRYDDAELASAVHSVRQGLTEARGLLGVLGPAPEAWERVVSHLRWDNACACAQAGIQLEFDAARDPAAPHFVTPMALHALRRIALEAVTNVIRHGSATRVGLHLELGREELRLRVEDDGQGSTDTVEGRGLSGIRRRVTRLGGGATFGNAATGGFSVEIWFRSDDASEPRLGPDA